MPTRRSLMLAAAIGAAALGLYVATLAPGLIAIEDTPKFQFVGRVLGTAHPPGYPFYVVVSHLFGLLPIGNLAWRINLLSAMFAACTVVFYQLAAIEVGVAPAIAALGGLALATGAGFWFSATIAEVYSLHGTLFAAMTYALLRWRRTGRNGWFFAAIAAFSIGLGHHTSIVTVGPAVALFAILVAPRFALSPRTIAAILGLFALGFSQYLFVLVRTWQGAWGESPASNLRELIDVIRGARWTSYLAPPTFGTVGQRLPGVLERLAAEVSWPAAVAALVGAGVLAWKDRPSLALMLGSMAGVIGFSTFFSGQTDGFLQPAFVLLWLLTAVGLDAVLRWWAPVRRHAGAVGAVLLGAVAAWHLAVNLEARDLSHRRFDMRYFDALAAQLPPHSGLMAEDFLVDRMMLYEKFSGPAFAARDIVAPVEAVPDRVREYAGRGYGLFAFAKNAAGLRRDGFAVDYAMWPLEYGTLREYLADQPRGSMVAIAVPAMRLGASVGRDGLALDEIGGQAPGPSFSNVVAIGAIRDGRAVQAERPQGDTASVFAGRGTVIGGRRVTSPTDILAEATYDRASIRIGAREIIRSREPVVAVWTPRGDLLGAFALNASGRVPMPDSPLSIHRIRDSRPWIPIGADATDLTSAASGGHVIVRQPAAGSTLVIYAARRERGLEPRLYDMPASFGSLRVEPFEGGGSALRAALARDGWGADPDLLAGGFVYRITLPGPAGAFHLGFGGLPDRVTAHWTGSGEAPSFSGMDLTGQLEPIDGATMRLHVARDHHQLFLGGGWTPISADETGAFAQVVAQDAELLVPCEPASCTTLEAQLWAEQDGRSVAISVNGIRLDPQPMHANWHYYRWTVPPAALRRGMNSVVLSTGQGVRLGDVLVPHAR